MWNKGLITRVPWADAFTRREPLAPRPDSEPLHHLDRLGGRGAARSIRGHRSAHSWPRDRTTWLPNRFTEQRRGQVPKMNDCRQNLGHSAVIPTEAG
jgi:hypothetical protein